MRILRIKQVIRADCFAKRFSKASVWVIRRSGQVSAGRNTRNTHLFGFYHAAVRNGRCPQSHVEQGLHIGYIFDMEKSVLYNKEAILALWYLVNNIVYDWLLELRPDTGWPSPGSGKVGRKICRK